MCFIRREVGPKQGLSPLIKLSTTRRYWVGLWKGGQLEIDLSRCDAKNQLARAGTMPRLPPSRLPSPLPAYLQSLIVYDRRPHRQPSSSLTGTFSCSSRAATSLRPSLSPTSLLMVWAIDVLFGLANYCSISGSCYILRDYYDIIYLNIELKYHCMLVLWSIKRENPID